LLIAVEAELSAETGGGVTIGLDIRSEGRSSFDFSDSFVSVTPDNCFGVKSGTTLLRSVIKSISGSWSPSSRGIKGEERMHAAPKTGAADVTCRETGLGGYLEMCRNTAKLEVDLQKTIYQIK